MSVVILFVCMALGIILLLLLSKVARIKSWGWLTFYCCDRVARLFRIRKYKGPRHILFLFVDHFEPGNYAALEQWLDGYEAFARQHHDADGRPPRHTWFYPLERFDDKNMARIIAACGRGLGEIEVHLHHHGDTEDSLRQKMLGYLAQGARLGLFRTGPDEQTYRFGFIHGNWALDNSRRGNFCGVNSELRLLKELGCYADFTFPAHSEMQPAKINRIYYALDNPQRPKSYTWGKDVVAGGQPYGDLMIFQGPLLFDWKNWRKLIHPRCESAGLEFPDEMPSRRRVDLWIQEHIHVAGRPEWTFVKINTHGMVPANFDLVAGAPAHAMHTYLEQHYNDGERFVLHYVTAREAYNIVKAAESGMQGDPYAYRDFIIKPYLQAGPGRQ